MRSHFAPPLLLALLVMLTGRPAAGFTVSRSGSGHELRWASMPVRWSVNLAGFSKVPGDHVIRALKEAISSWTDPSCTHLRTAYSGTSDRTSSYRDETNVVTFPLHWPHSSQALAVTIPAHMDGALVDADIEIDSDHPWSTNPGPKEVDLVHVARHEMGHMLGLGHSSHRGAVMFHATESGSSHPKGLHKDDRAGVCYLYPANGAPSCSHDSDCPAGGTCRSGVCSTWKQPAPAPKPDPARPSGTSSPSSVDNRTDRPETTVAPGCLMQVAGTGGGPGLAGLAFLLPLALLAGPRRLRK